jgi:hypothetical protein
MNDYVLLIFANTTRLLDLVAAKAREGTTFIATARAIQAIKLFGCESERLAVRSSLRRSGKGRYLSLGAQTELYRYHEVVEAS